MTLRLTISRAILIFGLVTALGLGAVIATSVYGLSQLKVGGPLYNQIKLGNDLIADILPPPEYVIEAYLEATLVLHDPAQLAAHRDRIAQLKKEYDERREFWVKSDLDPTLKTKLVEKSDSEVQPLLDRDPGRPAARISQGRQCRGDEILCGDHRTLRRAPRHHRRHRQANQRSERGDGGCCDRTRQHVHPAAVGCFRGGVSHHRCGHLRRGIRRDSPDRGDDCRDEGAGRRRPQCFGPGAQPRRRSGRHGARGPGLQGQRAARSVDGTGAGRPEAEGGRRSQGRDAADGGRLRFRDRKNHPDRIDRLLRTRIIGRTTDQDRRSDPGAFGNRRLRIGAILGQRAVRRGGRGRDGLVGVGDQPPGPGFAQDIARGGEPGRADQCADCRSRPVRQPDRRSGQDDQRGRRADQPAWR